MQSRIMYLMIYSIAETIQYDMHFYKVVLYNMRTNLSYKDPLMYANLS
jgi:hypothetical protein